MKKKTALETTVLLITLSALLLGLNLSLQASHPAYGMEHAKIVDVEHPSKVYDGEAARLTFRIENPSITGGGATPPRFFLRLYLDGGLVKDELPESWECPKGGSVERVIVTPPLQGPRGHLIRGELYWLNQSIAILQDVKTIEIKAVKLQIEGFSQSISEVTLGRSQPMEFQVQFSNGGNDVMYDVTLTVADSPGIEVTPKQVAVGDLPIGESAKITLELLVEPTLSEGSVKVSYEVSYKDFKDNLHVEGFETELSILKASSNLQLYLEGGEAAYNSEVTVRAHLTGLEGRALPGEPVEFYIDNRSMGVRITDDKGIATIEINSTLDVGIHEVKALYRGSPTYAPSSAAKTLKILPATTSLHLSIPSSTLKVDEETIAYVKLTDEKGSPIGNAEILLYCDETLIARGITNSTGEATLPIRLDSSGDKLIKAIYRGDVNHKGTESLGHIKAKPLQTSIEIQAPSQAWRGDQITYKIVLTDELGRPIKAAPIDVEISSKNMPIARLSLKTDDRGTAEGLFNATIGGELKISVNYFGDRQHAPAEATYTLTVMEASMIALMIIPVAGAVGGIAAAIFLRRGAFSNLRESLSRNIGRGSADGPLGRRCVSCGRVIPSDAAFCDWCGSPQTDLPPREEGQMPPQITSGEPPTSGGEHGYGYSYSYPEAELDSRVLSYIAEHGGEISLSRATAELGVTRGELLAAIDRLKRSGRLEPV